VTDAVVALAPTSFMTKAACAALGVARASVQRRRARLAAPPTIPRPRPRPARALTAPQQQTVLDLLHAPRFADQAPAEIYAILLDEGVYHCSIRTMYRILGQHDEVRERRQQLRHPVYQKPELLAERPNQVWSWDITKLMGPTKWSYFYLYVILDIFSRRVVGWCIADAESASLFKPLFDDAIAKHDVPPGQLTLHADRGGPMKAKATALLLADLGVTRSHNRPHTSNDNPFSESHFKTLKYRPQFPQRFGCIEDARSFCRPFFDWYNQDHHHVGIGLMTPDQVHYGQTDAVHAARQHTLDHAFRANPERFVNHPPVPPAKPTAAWINPPTPKGRSTLPTLAPLKAAPRCVPPHRVVPGNPSPRPPSALCLMGPPPLGSVTSRDADLPTPPTPQPAISQVMDEATAMPTPPCLPVTTREAPCDPIRA
jgi:putative transposase